MHSLIKGEWLEMKFPFATLTDAANARKKTRLFFFQAGAVILFLMMHKLAESTNERDQAFERSTTTINVVPIEAARMI
jgi:hypothetical protein